MKLTQALMGTLILMALALLLMLSSLAPVLAHEWYAPACCSGRDCAPIPASAVTVAAVGYRVRLKFGDHPMIPYGAELDEVMPFTKLMPSQDGSYHACVGAGDFGGERPYLLCLYGFHGS